MKVRYPIDESTLRQTRLVVWILAGGLVLTAVGLLWDIADGGDGWTIARFVANVFAALIVGELGLRLNRTLRAGR